MISKIAHFHLLSNHAFTDVINARPVPVTKVAHRHIKMTGKTNRCTGSVGSLQYPRKEFSHLSAVGSLIDAFTRPLYICLGCCVQFLSFAFFSATVGQTMIFV
jgi:hypothetical protein